MNKIKTSQIFQDFKASGILASMTGPDVEIRAIRPAEESGPGILVFLHDKKYVNQVTDGRPSAVVTNNELVEKLADLKETTIFISPNVNLAQALLRQKYDDYDYRQTEWPRIHPSAVIHESVRIPESVIIGPLVVIGKEVQIGENCVIMANTVIEHNTVIGENTIIQPLENRLQHDHREELLYHVGRGTRIGRLRVCPGQGFQELSHPADGPGRHR